MKQKLLKFFLIILQVIVIPIYAFGETILFENFDSDKDWTVAQPVGSGINSCWNNCDIPTGWTSYYSGNSVCKNGPGNNNFYLNGNNARGGAGKSLTFWDESCSDNFADSDGDIGTYLGKTYNEIYISFYIKFAPEYKWENPTNYCPQHKFVRAFYWGNKPDDPYIYHNQADNQPIAVGTLQMCNGTLRYLAAFRSEVNYSGGDVGVTIGDGNWKNQLGDGNWHLWEFYAKMNTNNGSTFNADGIHRFWIDGDLTFEATDIVFSENGSEVNPRRGWDFVAIGGNNLNRWIRDCSGSECEQWYTIDDLTISTQRVGVSNMVTTPNLLTSPSAPKNLKVVGQN